MRILSSLIIATAFVLPMTLAACGGDDGGDAEPFDNLMDCYNDHLEELHSSTHAITTCCLDHPIAGMDAPSCGESEAACEAYVSGMLDDTVPDADIQAGCQDYASQRGLN